MKVKEKFLCCDGGGPVGAGCYHDHCTGPSKQDMNKEQFEREYLGKFEPDNSYQGIYNRIRFVSKEEIADEIAGHLEAQYFLEERVNNLLVECESRLKQISYQQDQINTLVDHIENLKKASQDYCMCGMRVNSHGVAENHSPLSEFDWYIKEHNL